jgi:hypothetical protein
MEHHAAFAEDLRRHHSGIDSIKDDMFKIRLVGGVEWPLLNFSPVR